MQLLLRRSAGSQGMLLGLSWGGPLGAPHLRRAQLGTPQPTASRVPLRGPPSLTRPPLALSAAAALPSCMRDNNEFEAAPVGGPQQQKENIGAPLSPLKLNRGPLCLSCDIFSSVSSFKGPEVVQSPSPLAAELRGPLGPHRGPLVSLHAHKGSPGVCYQRRFFGVGGSYGYGAFFRGEADVYAKSNVQLQRLEEEGAPKGGPMTMKMPETLAKLVAEGALRRQLSRPGVSVFHHHVPYKPNKSLVFLTATTKEAGAPAAAAAVSLVQQRERGVAAQLILDGRGVKAYFDPDWPNLMVRLGVGVKPLALRRLAEQYATKAKIFVDKRGLLLTIHGWDKRAVGTLTMELYRHLKANPYTGKGARIAFYPINKKVPTKR